jgi:AcrR family transcriptional regulator
MSPRRRSPSDANEERLRVVAGRVLPGDVGREPGRVGRPSDDGEIGANPVRDSTRAADLDRELAEAEPGWRARVVGRSLAPAAEKAVRRGQQLISSASRLIHRSGGADTTVQQVAAEAGLTLRAFYQHFSGKDELLIALMEEAQLVMARLLVQQAARFDDPLDRIGGALYWALDERQHTAGDYNAAMMRVVQRSALTIAPERLAAARRPVVAVFTRLIDEAMADGAIERGDAERSAFAWMALHSSFVRVHYLGNDLSSRLPSIPELVRFCVLGLGARLPVGWEERFVITDEQAAVSKRASEKLAADVVRASERESEKR